MKQKLLKDLKSLEWQKFIILTIAGIINAFGVTCFLQPVRLYDGGISGTSMFLDQITPDFMSLSIFLVILNVPIFLYGLKRQGLVFTIYSIYTVAIYSLFAFLITDVFPIDVSVISPLAGSDLFLCALFGGIISGIGSGLTIRFGGALDGIEVLAVVFAKKLNISVGTFVMIYNCILYIIAGIVVQSWVLPLYSIVAYGCGLKAVDFIVEGIDRSKSVMIITDKPNEVSTALMCTFETGTTKISAKGGYSNTDKTVIYFVVNRFQISKMKEIIRRADPCAYVTIADVADIYKATDISKKEYANACDIIMVENKEPLKNVVESDVEEGVEEKGNIEVEEVVEVADEKK